MIINYFNTLATVHPSKKYASQGGPEPRLALEWLRLCGAPKSWPHLQVRSLSRGGSGGHYRYPTDRVPRIQALNQDKEKCVHLNTTTCHMAPDPASLSRQARTLPHASRLAPRLLGAVTCCTTPDPTSLLGRAPVLSRVARLRTPPPCSVGLQCCHVPHGFRPRLPARKGSSATTCHMTSDLTTLLGRAPILPRVTRLRTPPPCSGGLQCCHVPHGFRPCLPVRGAPALSRVPRPKESRGP
jgi:hypothetical protein